MPNNIVKSFADRIGRSVEDVERLWDKAKDIASEAGHKDDYQYITGVLKKMLNINECKIINFRDFINENLR